MHHPFLQLALLASITVLGPASSYAEAADAEDHREPAGVENAEKIVMKITDQGLVPSTLTLRSLDGSVFFVNTTRDSLATLNVDFAGKRAHCASGNMELKENGTLGSKAPIGPRDFAIACFPQPGTYAVRAFGINGKDQATVGEVRVEGSKR